MQIRNHRLCDDAGNPVPFRRSPNVGGTIKPELLVMHFTAGASAESSTEWLCNPESKASAHLVIGRDGAVTQLVPFNTKAWHAGESEWKDRRFCNGFSIGIELDNAGKLERKGGKWVSDFGRTYPDEEVVRARHKNETAEAGWHRYTPEQLRSARDAAAAILREYRIGEIVGHEDIAPGRKNDPGPSFPMESFRAEVSAGDGARPQDSAAVASGVPEVRVATALDYVVNTATDLRTAPSPKARKATPKPLEKGTRVRPARQDWWFVEIVGPKSPKPLKGWVRASDLVRSTDIPAPVPVPSPGEKPAHPTPAVAPSSDAAAKRRLVIAAKIVDFEARRDSQGRIAVYNLPSGDGGGSYEIAGINQRYHPDQAAKLRDLINSGRHAEAEALAAEHIAQYTDVVAKWTQVPPVESYLRDCAFNRGPGGAAKILQIALGVKPDGGVGPVTIEALRKAEENIANLLTSLRAAREDYELRVAGRRAKFWKGLVNRWDNAMTFAKSLA